MTYYLYHIPVSQTSHADLNKQRLVGDYNLIVAAKGAARRFIGKGRKNCIITSKPLKMSTDILYWVKYQDGRKLYRDPRTAEEFTGWFFYPYTAKGPTEIQNYRGRVKYKAKGR